LSGGLLQMVSWVVRFAAYVVVGAYLFRESDLPSARQSAVVAAYLMAGAVMVLWEWLNRRRPDASGSVWGAIALGGVATVSGLGASIPRAGPLIALGVIATLDAGSDTSLTAGWSVFGTGVLAVEVGALAESSGDIAVLGYPLLLLVGLLGGHNRRAYRVQAEQSARMLAQSEQVRVQLRRVAVLGERTRIAREIHDVLAHSLGALGIQIQLARAVLEDRQDVPRAMKALEVAQRIASEGLTETRRAVHALRTDALPLQQELASMAREHEQHHGTNVDITVIGRPGPLPAESSQAFARIARESLTNAAKHAPGRPVELRLEYREGAVILEIVNALGNGPQDGSFATVDGGYGLTGMKERFALLGGVLTVHAEDGWWAVRARAGR
jgi:signal transduction histidine kinase